MAPPRPAITKVILAWPLWARLLGAVVAAALGSGFQAFLERELGSAGEFLPFQFAAVLVSAVYLGTLPGLLSVVLTTIVAISALPPGGFLDIRRPTDLIAIGLYTALGSAVVFLSHARRQAEARAQAATDALTTHARQLEAEVTARRQAEEGLKLSNERLEEFSHAVAHDLKEPLRGLMFTAQFLEEDAGTKLDPKELSLLQRLRRTAQQMSNMLSMALAYARESHEGIQSTDTTTDTQKVATNVVELLGPWLDEQNAKVIIHDPLPPVHCDEASVTRVLTNLIANGVKYNRSSTKLVEVGGRQDPDEPPVLYVRDNGVGIPPAQRERAFGMFRKLQSSEDLSQGGTGAGLALTRRLIERHRGRIWICDDQGLAPSSSGTTFCFTLEPPRSEGPNKAPGRSA